MKNKYDSSWDLIKNDDGNSPGNEDAFDKIYAEWEKRSWESWLRAQLKFPFSVERTDDDGDAYFTDSVKEPFRLGHVMEAMDIETEDEHYGIVLRVKEVEKIGHVPLCDVEVTSRGNENFWPVREYAVWFANSR